MGLFDKIEKQPDLFVSKGHQGIGMGYLEVIVDRETGVNYIMASDMGGKCTFITPRLDDIGNPMIDEIEEEEEDEDDDE